MLLSTTRIYRNAAGEEIGADYVIMSPKTNIYVKSFLKAEKQPIVYKRHVTSTVFDVTSDLTVASIELIGNFTDRDSTAEKDWCTWDLLLDTVTSGTRDKKTIRCDMSDLKSVGDSIL